MKERLTGAIILVALIVLVVPELLTGPLGGKHAAIAKRAAATPDLPAGAGQSSKASAPLRSYTLALSPSGPSRSLGTLTDAPAAPPQGTAAAPAAAAGSRPPSSRSDSRPQAGAEVPAAPKPNTRPHGRGHTPERQARLPPAVRPPSGHGRRAGARWVVQLASFSRRANAERLTQRLRREHFKATIAPLRLRGRLWWRVWVGPLSSRAAAQHLARRLRPIGLRGEVLRE